MDAPRRIHPHGVRLTRAGLLRAGALAGVAGVVGCSSDGGSGGSAGGSATPPAASASASVSGSVSASASASASGSASSSATAAPDPRVAGVVATGLAVPWSIRFLPDADEPTALVSSRDTGDVVLVSAGSSRTVGTLDVVSRVDEGGETGLLGLALHPSYAENHLLYAYLTTAEDNRVVRMTYADGRLGRPTPVLTGIATSLHHNGGGLAFGPDGHLYVSTGDAEDSASAPDLTSLNGKVLRITDTGDVPAGNPHDTPVWTSGHRNVEGLAFDDQGRLWASEFGDHRYDELNHIVRGRDYGWPAVEGSDGRGGYADPLAQWPTESCSPSGIAIGAGRAWLGALQGECVYEVALPGTSGTRAGRSTRHLTGRYGRLRAVALAPDGSLWVGTSNRDGRTTPRSGDDRILRVAL